MTYVAKHPYDASHPDALAIYCSDGRFTEAIEELLRHLGHTRLDTLTLPGGPALLELNSAGFSQLETSRTSSSFLILGHGIKRVVLIAHEGCGYYKARHRFETPERVTAMQLVDLEAAGAWMLSAHPGLDVSMYYARTEGKQVGFVPHKPKKPHPPTSSP